ncbi:MAG: 1-phosphofructokinase family hexose kinase [Saprospiraceae bacterium]
MIVTLTLNPAIDQSAEAAAIAPDIKIRCEALRSEAGGGGINVSKALKRLDTDSTAVFPSGGGNGPLFNQLLQDLAIRTAPVPMAGSLRENLSVTDRHSGMQYRFILPSPTLSRAEADACLEQIRALKPSILVASGSLPDGLPADFYREVAECARQLEARFVLDTSGKALREGLASGAYLIKPNLAELSALAGVDQLEINQVDDAALELVRKGYCEVMVVSLGPQGALLVTADHFEHIPAPMVKPVSTIGAGDSMVAGMVWGMSQGMSLSQMAAFGVACGSAATITPGSELFHAADARRLYGWLQTYGQRYRLDKKAFD